MKRPRGIAIGILIHLLAVLFVPGPLAAAQTADKYEITLAALGYSDVTLYGPRSSAYYYFSLPPDWEVLDGSYITLDLDYQVILSQGTAYPPASLEVQLNYQFSQIENLPAPTIQQLRINLSPSYLRPPEDSRVNVVQIAFGEHGSCESVQSSSVTIKNTSTLHLAHRGRPLPIDLALFPKPIYQGRAIEPSYARFVLPDKPGETDVRAAAIIAARMGQLTDNQLPMSATLASEQLTYAPLKEHLVIVGSPDTNSVIRGLELPIPLVERQLALRSQMPMTVSPGSAMSYTLFVENTTLRPQSLIVEDRFSPAATFLGCGESCEPVAPGRIRWNVGSLAAGEQASKTVTVQVMSPPLFDALVRHTATLADSQGNILNVDTLLAQIGEKPDSRLVASPQQKSARFFVQGAQAVPEDAGILQEIVSPWSLRHVVIIVTGLNDEALLKAARGLNPQNRFPGISGASAVVEDVRPVSGPVSAPQDDLVLAALGYENRELSVADLEAEEFLFDFSPGVTVGQDSYLALHLAHAATVSAVGGEIKVSLNQVPIGSVSLDDSNLGNAWVRIPLGRVAIRPGLNRIRLQSIMSHLDRCLIRQNNPYWLAIYADSFLHLDSRPIQPRFDLDSFPYPFNRPGDMRNVILILPNVPSLSEIEGLVRIASLLGSSSQSKDFLPQVAFGGDPNPANLSGFDVIAIGLPTLNPIIRSVNTYLPQPFVPDSNDVYQSVDSPIYGISSGADLGFVQQVPSPWDKENNHEILVATGTTEESVRWAVSALAQRRQLTGNLAIVRNNEIYSTDTRPAAPVEVFTMTVPPASTPAGILSRATVVTSTAQPTPHQTMVQATATRDYTPSTDTSLSRPLWLIPLFIVSTLTIAVLVALSIRKAR